MKVKTKVHGGAGSVDRCGNPIPGRPILQPQ
jgi:hypothetical protein